MKFKVLWPFFLFLAVAPFTPSIDLLISHFFYDGTSFYDNGFFRFLFHYGERFGLCFGVFSACIFLASFWITKCKKWRRAALAMVLTLCIGAGLITNSIFKGYWGRPRPKQVIEFGGHHEYRPFWKPNFDTKNDPQKSFPSGHVAMGFYFLSLCLTARRYKSPLLFWTGVFFTVGLGGGLMITRVAQGGHFFSDVLFSPILMLYVSVGIDKILFTSGEFQEPLQHLKHSCISPKLDDV